MKTFANLIAIAAIFIASSFALAQESAGKPNLLTNPSFEDGSKGWVFSSYGKRGTMTIDTTEKHDGKNSIRIENSAGDDSFLKQTVAVKRKTRYRLTGFIKTEEVEVKGTGATLSLEGGFEHTASITGKHDWTKVSFEFDSGVLDTVKVGPRLGHHSSMAVGVAWFNALSLVEVGPSTGFLANARELPNMDETNHELRGWGTAIDPNHDCTFFVAKDTLLISVPGSCPHDLAAEIDSINAPRVLQPVRGDFTVQVRVDGRFAPGEESTKPERTGYNGAAIVAMCDEQNVVTLARAVLQHAGEDAVPYANFEIRVAGQLQRIGLTGDHPLPKDGPVFLRLERRGSKFLGAVSTDGEKWDVLKPKEVPQRGAKN